MFGLTFKKLVFIAVIAAGFFVAAQYAPAYFTYYQFNDAVLQQVKYAAASRKDPERVRRDIVEKAKEMDLDVGPKDIHITRRGPAFTLEFDYDWPINLRVYQHTITFHISQDGEVFGP